MELIRLGGPAHGIVTTIIHKSLPGSGGGPGGRWAGPRGVVRGGIRVGGRYRVVGVQRVGG